MKISGDAVTSAETGVPSYTVAEEDRAVVWTFTKETLAEMKAWDAMSFEEKRKHLTSGSWSTFGPEASVDWYEPHAVVARNSLRNFLGLNNDLPPKVKG